DELGEERVAQVVNSSALALGRGQLESTRQEVQVALKESAPAPAERGNDQTGEGSVLRPKTVPRATPSSQPAAKNRSAHLVGDTSAAWEIAAGAGYLVALRGEEGPAHGPGLGARLERSAGFRPGVTLSAYRALPWKTARREVSL